jgi:iron complex transport system substrate-binding protein
MMRICSLLPGATEIVAALGLVEELVGISHECDYPYEILTKQILIETLVNPEQTSSAIDQQVRSSLRDCRTLFRLNEIALRQIDPTLIITRTSGKSISSASFSATRDWAPSLASWRTYKSLVARP